jgi:hypothetical protein
MTQLACSEEKADTLIIWTNLGLIDLPIQFDEQYWCKSMLPNLKQFFESYSLLILSVFGRWALRS